MPTAGVKPKIQMRHYTPKRQAENEAGRQDVDDFRIRNFLCWMCCSVGRLPPSTDRDVHHIAGKAHFHRDHPANLAASCRRHHDRTQSIVEFFPVWAALKEHWDAENADRETLRWIRSGLPSRSDMRQGADYSFPGDEIDRYLKILQTGDPWAFDEAVKDAARQAAERAKGNG